MSIPRLEVLAWLIGMRSRKFVSKELKLENTKIIVWIDLQCVLLNWIKTKKPLSIFRSKQVNQNHEREECQVPLYPYERPTK